jgi:hypothetical protein
MTLNDLTINPKNIATETLLEDWHWILKELSKVVLITAMGDLFIQGESGRVYFIDVCGGQLQKVSDNGPQFEDLLHDVDFVTDRFYPNLISQYRAAKRVLTEGACYSHKVALVLGGLDDIENIEVTDVQVHVSIMGQIHSQVKDLPPSTKIDKVKIN